MCHCPSSSNVLVGEPEDGGEFDCDTTGELREDSVNEGIRLGAEGPGFAWWPRCISATLVEFERRKSDLNESLADLLTGDCPFSGGIDGGGSWVVLVETAGCGSLGGGVAGTFTMSGFIGETAADTPVLPPIDPT